MFRGFRKFVYERHPGAAGTSISLLLVLPLLVLCGVFGVLQYRWIGEVSIAEQSRLRSNLQLSLTRISDDFDAEISRDCRAIAGFDNFSNAAPFKEQIASRYAEWRSGTSHQPMFRRIAFASHAGNSVVLEALDLDNATFAAQPWPAEWTEIRQRVESGIPPRPAFDLDNTTPALELPLVSLPDFASPPPDPRILRNGLNWIIFEFNESWLLDNLLPDLFQLYLGSGGRLDYLIQVVARGGRQSVIFESNPDHAANIISKADGQINLFNLSWDQLIRPPGMPAPGRFSPRGSRPRFGRWQVFVRHRSGSLDAVVTMARRRNMAVTAGVLLLMIFSAGALVHVARRAQRLAQLQMNFITGVSHELRTPLSVIYLAGHNLETTVTHDPTQVAEYGVLIQQESRRLNELVEQVLRFASVKAGHTIHEWKPLSITQIVEKAIDSNWTDRPRELYTVERHIRPDVPLVTGDKLALEHAFQNLLSNAARHAMKISPWLAVSVGTSPDRSEVEVRITDRGPGIPADERSRIFDPFFRGQRAIEDQVHGTGLGLSLVKSIIEAHGGTIGVAAQSAGGAEFVIRLPASPQEQPREFTDSFSRG
jgi:signal transduction histidine kinase